MRLLRSGGELFCTDLVILHICVLLIAQSSRSLCASAITVPSCSRTPQIGLPNDTPEEFVLTPSSCSISASESARSVFKFYVRLVTQGLLLRIPKTKVLLGFLESPIPSQDSIRQVTNSDALIPQSVAESE